MKQNKTKQNNLLEANYLQVSGGHSIYYHVYGNPQGFPIFIIHGGPGGGSTPILNKLFNLDVFKLIYIDQRGCGKSKPRLELKNNTTQALIEDIEALRLHLNLTKIALFGGSWGTTLALAYAVKYPLNVERILLRAVFLGRQEDIDFLYEANGASDYYPDYFETYSTLVKDIPGNSILEKYYNVFTSHDSEFKNLAVQTFYNWEACLVSVNKFRAKLNPSKQELKSYLDVALLETHYFVNKCFFNDDNYILKHAKMLKDIPVDIVHGRQDVDCRPIGAYLLHKELSNSKLYLVDGAGHTSLDKNLWNALKTVTKNWENIYAIQTKN